MSDPEDIGFDVPPHDVELDREFIRQRFHHDVLCLVLKELLPQITTHGRLVNLTSNPGFASLGDVVETARMAASFAYPPPKAEGT